MTAEEARAARRRGRQLFERHRFMLILSAGVVLATFLLRTRADGRVELRNLPALPMPELCGSRLLWDVECPGCGLTRSFIAISRGEWEASLRLNRVGWLFALAVLMQFPYRLHALAELRRGVLHDRRWPRHVGHLLIIALIANWLLKQCGV